MTIKLDKTQKAALADLKVSAEIARRLFYSEDVAAATQLVYASCFFDAGKLDDEAVKNLELAASVADDLFPAADKFEAVAHMFDDGDVHGDLIDNCLRPSVDIAREVFGKVKPSLADVLVVAAKVFEYDPDSEEGEEE